MKTKLDPQSSVLDVRDLHVSYGDVHALTGVDFAIGSGKICAIVGMNGSGKSTFFKSIMGLVNYQQGTITIAHSSSLIARKAGKVGYVPQNEEIDTCFPLSVYDVVMMGRYGLMGPRRKPLDADKTAVANALDVVGLTGLENRPIGALSGGQRKRAFVARAVAQGAELMLLDEPFAGVDFTSAAVITELLQRLADLGTTLLVSTHDLSTIPDFADEVALLNRQIVGRGDPQETLRTDNLRRAFTAPAGYYTEKEATK
ncbi:metal ABC transporter ATP-binding protein [Arcanobacterium phocae]|uniref:metal ABC transporter ATP-binding protein n=1 Tax=Arcanobacterium phocae TaxID=131112 RepID=UPI001C0EBF8B|nr:metal ABC transporter ATP-binding protein [Arcanobacterium phocae]